MGRVSGKVALVTGGARGMGAAFARRLVEEGALVMVTDILDKEGRATVERLGAGARFRRHDVTSEADWIDVVAETEASFGPLSVLVNNAGIASHGAIETLEVADYRRTVDVNQVSVFLGIKSVIPSMKRAGGGSIINIASIASFVGTANLLSYTATKAAVLGMTKTAAVELAPLNIRVNSVHPGIIRTPMTVPGPGTEEILANLASSSPLARIGEPEEVAEFVLMLASDESRFATGAEFKVDGGFTCQ